ncbi:MAG: hypothetical protein JKY89_01760 [Immundisolibacteraceae bacterium]|nr:hypothetical protein [Immundisolibacteraceae bacterium]
MPQLENPLIIDVEASGFGAFSYPIEIGIAMDDDEKYCTLILPAPDWTHWDESAEKIHRVPRDILETYGKPMNEVTKQLNELLRGKTVYSDGWVVDKPWLTTLFHAAGVEMDFFVSPLEMILSEPQMSSWHQTKDMVIAEMNLARHRASYDAVIIQETYKRTLDASDD